MGQMERGRFMGHGPCKICGSSDAVAWYEKPSGKKDGYCWAHRGYVKENGEELEFSEDLPRPTIQLEDAKFLPIEALPKRKLSSNTASVFEVRTEYSEETGEVSKYYFPYYNNKGEVIAYKWKTPDKKMGIMGDGKNLPFFGIKGFETSGKAIFITEGEEDCMAAWQMFKAKSKNYKVVSIPNGASHAKVICQKHLEWLETFETIFLLFDNDEPGKKAVEEVVPLFSSGKCKVVRLPEKDANACLMAEKQAEFYQAVVSAKAHKPEGIVSGGDTWDAYKNRPVVPCVPYPEGWDDIQEKTYGLRIGELDTWTSGSGMGKTQIIRELQYHLLQQTNDNIGIIALEEPLVDSVEALMAVHLKRRIQFPDVRSQFTEEELYNAWLATSGTNRLHYFDHWGSINDESLLSKIRFLAKGLGCKYIFLDHLSIVVSEFASEGGERERIDTIMSKLKALTQECQFWMGLVVHLRKTSGGASFEEGGIPSLDDLRGSGSIKQLSNGVYALSRNQQAQDEIERNTSTLHVLKCRFTGRTGRCDRLYFEDDTGRMVKREETLDEFEDNDDSF